MVFGGNPGARAIEAAEATLRQATSKRERKTEAVGRAAAAGEHLKEEITEALKADDDSRAESLTAELAKANQAHDLAARALEIATEGEQAAAAELERLTAEIEGRRRQKLAGEKYQKARELVEAQKTARDQIISQHAELERIVGELADLGAGERASDIRERRLDVSKWGAFFRSECNARVPLEAADWETLAPGGAARIRTRAPRYSVFGRLFSDAGDVVRFEEFTAEQWKEIRANPALIVSKVEANSGA